MDANKLRIEVFEKTGIKVDTTDPIFALVALNEAVLADYAQQNLGSLQDASDKLTQQTRLLLEAGERAKALLLQMGHKVNDSVPSTAPATPKSPGQSMPPLVLAGVTALLAAVLVVVIQGLFSAPRQAPAATLTQAPTALQALTPEQKQMMQDGEKFTKALPKLDAKTRAKLQEAMQ